VEKFQCPKCHCTSDVEVVPNQHLIDMQNKIRNGEDLYPFIADGWFKKSILKDNRTRCIICPVCGDMTKFQ
jgi:hypothetical protein